METKDYLNIELQDDETENGGISFMGETLKDFLESICMDFDTPLSEVNEALKDCGIKEIK